MWIDETLWHFRVLFQVHFARIEINLCFQLNNNLPVTEIPTHYFECNLFSACRERTASAVCFLFRESGTERKHTSDLCDNCDKPHNSVILVEGRRTLTSPAPRAFIISHGAFGCHNKSYLWKLIIRALSGFKNIAQDDLIWFRGSSERRRLSERGGGIQTGSHNIQLLTKRAPDERHWSSPRSMFLSLVSTCL